MKNENDLDNVKNVIWRNKVYEIGNRRLNLAELYEDGKFIRIVNIKSLTVHRNNKAKSII